MLISACSDKRVTERAVKMKKRLAANNKELGDRENGAKSGALAQNANRL